MYPFLKGRKGGFHLVHDNYIYRSNFRRQGVQRNIYYWECINNRKGRCRGRLKTIGDKLYVANSNGKRRWNFLSAIFSMNFSDFSVPHNHEFEGYRIEEARVKGHLTLMSLNEAAKEYDAKAAIKVEMIHEEVSIN